MEPTEIPCLYSGVEFGHAFYGSGSGKKVQCRIPIGSEVIVTLIVSSTSTEHLLASL